MLCLSSFSSPHVAQLTSNWDTLASLPFHLMQMREDLYLAFQRQGLKPSNSRLIPNFAAELPGTNPLMTDLPLT